MNKIKFMLGWLKPLLMWKYLYYMGCEEWEYAWYRSSYKVMKGIDNE